MSADSLISQFLSAMRQTGFEPDCKIVADGKLHRFRDWLDKPGTKNGWYILYPDFPPAGAFGCWKRGISEKWSGSNLTTNRLISQKFISIEKAMAEEHQKGRKKATEKWLKARPSNGNHGYLLSKHVKAHGARYLNGALLVPVMDIAGQLHGLQCIYRDGSKRFTCGTEKRGNFFMIGSPRGDVICIAEGFATAATIHEVTGHTVVVAFGTDNIQPVAINLRTAFTDYQLVFCADNDRRIEGNPGMTKAQQAAEAVSGLLVYPSFADQASCGSDFNDLFIESGAEAVRCCIALQGGTQNVSHT